MKTGKFPFFAVIITIVIALFIIAKLFSNRDKTVLVKLDQQPIPTQTIATTLPSGAEKIEVFVFHATQRCISCINIGKYTKAVIEDKFSEEYKSGKIIFKEINIDLPENFKIVQEYSVGGSALYINVIKNGKNNHEQDTTVWRLVTNEPQLKNYFESKLKALL